MFALIDRTYGSLNRLGDSLLPLLARLTFAGVLFMYYINSGLTKLGDGIAGLWTPSLGAYAQIFPKQMEAVGYDVSQLPGYSTIIVLAGTWAEFILPVLIIVGLLTRPAALGMIGFVVVQSLTDIIGHGAEAGAWFDGSSDSLIMDQRSLWVLLLLILVFKGAGWLSLDRLINGRGADPVV